MTDQRRILIIDDEPSARKTLKMLLHNQNYDLAFAASGSEAISICQQTPPDIILLDVMMPDMDGYEVSQRLKEDTRFRHIPIILITALDSKEALIRGLEAGADEFLSKPINGLELRTRIRAMLRIKQQYDELQATLQMKDDLSDMIVHDMRSPLTTIMGFSQFLLTESDLAPHYLANIELIYDQAHRLHDFINDLLILAKMENNQFVLNRTSVNINQLIERVEQNHQVIARIKKIDLITEVPDAMAKPMALDANLFQRVLDNLLSNALKFSPNCTTVRLCLEYPTAETATEPGVAVRVQVIDEGPGIPAQHRDHIFERFAVLTLRQENVSQVGLGLAFCKLVIEAHGGKIFVTNNQPKGSVFTIEV